MDELSPEQEIRFIKEMIERTRRITAGSWMFLLVWGIVPILGIAGMYALVAAKKFSWIWLNWVIFVGAGVVFSLAYGSKLDRRSGIRTYAEKATGHIAWACAVGFILAGFVFPLLKLYSWEVIPVLISLVAGILIFSLGGIYDWALLKWCGAFFWLGALGMLFIHENSRALVFIPLILVGYILPAFVLRAKYHRQTESHGS